MKKIIDALVELLKVKSIITLAIVGALVYLAISGIVEVAIFTGIASSILTYYFTKKDGISEEYEEKHIEQIIDKLQKEKEKYIIEEETEHE